MKKASSPRKKKVTIDSDFRPYRVLFLVIVVGVTSLVLFALLGVSSG